jgi:hypothetical protein
MKLATFSLLILARSCESFVSPINTRVVTKVVVPVSQNPRVRSLSSPSTGSDDLEGGDPSRLEKLMATFSQTVAVRLSKKYKKDILAGSHRNRQLVTLFRVGVPSVLAGIAGFFLFPALAVGLATTVNDAGVFAVLSQDSSQFVQNFLSVAGLLFSILAGQTYYFMYQQQESVYYALFNEVTEAKSLLEQVALVCQGRTMYKKVLASIATYVRDDLKQLQADPAVLLSSRPVDDPLETIMYMTSVGVPSTVYETVRSLRQARAQRLGALQRKLPQVHMVLLWTLAAIELSSFPLLGAGTQVLGGYNLLSVEGLLFGVMTAGIVMTMRVSISCTVRLYCLVSIDSTNVVIFLVPKQVVGELWSPAGGAYNVDNVLAIMVSGLEDELKARMAGTEIFASVGQFPSPAVDAEFLKKVQPSEKTESIKLMQQGADISTPFRRLAKWIGKNA